MFSKEDFVNELSNLENLVNEQLKLDNIVKQKRKIEEEKAKNLNRKRAANILMNCNIFQPEDEWSREMLLTVGIRGQSFKQWLEALNIDTTKENWEEVYYTKLKNLFDKKYFFK